MHDARVAGSGGVEAAAAGAGQAWDDESLKSDDVEC